MRRTTTRRRFGDPIPRVGESHVLCKVYSEVWGKYMPVNIMHSEESIQLHCEEGDHHNKAIGKAKEILMKHGYKVTLTKSPTYYHVVKARR
jgi:hypothetical protein